MFSLHDFVMNTLHGMVGIYPRWQVQQIALGYYGKGWIFDADLAAIEEWYTPAPFEEDETEASAEEAPEPHYDATVLAE